MRTLKPISPEPSPRPLPGRRSTEPALVRRLSRLSLRGISASETPSQPSKLARLTASPYRILDFDIETLAGGYADPAWVPDKVTAVAWAWNGSDDIQVRCDPEGFFDRAKRRWLLEPLLEAIDQADMLTGHNIVRFDLRVLDAECRRLDLPRIAPTRVQDTIQLGRPKGFKKGQDDLSNLLNIPVRKRSMGWQEWDDAYAEGAPWPTVQERVRSDVQQHRLMREAMLQRGWLKEPKPWMP